MSDYAVDVQACRARQQRLFERMQELNLELTIVTQRANIQWLTGAYFPFTFNPVAALREDGQLTLVGPAGKVPEPVAADEVLPYEAQWLSTLRNDQREASSRVLMDSLQSQPVPQRIGVEFSSFGPHLAGPLATEMVDVEPALYVLRRRKDADEIELMKKAIAGTEAMYAHARRAIEPGINELDLYSQLHAAAVTEFGEALTYFGQDFQCNSRGGPPRNREAQQGELYILDLGSGFRGYYSDNARTFAVGGAPDEKQQQAWRRIVGVFDHIEATVRPGVSAKQLYHEVKQMLDEAAPWEFPHHLGHGVGLFPHEAPHLNPNWDDTFQEGEIFTAEPALYHDELQHGIRLEQNYLVTGDGLELLTKFPLEL